MSEIRDSTMRSIVDFAARRSLYAPGRDQQGRLAPGSLLHVFHLRITLAPVLLRQSEWLQPRTLRYDRTFVVRVAVTISPAGIPSLIHITHTGGAPPNWTLADDVLDDAIRANILASQFRQGYADGQPVDGTIMMTYLIQAST